MPGLGIFIQDSVANGIIPVFTYYMLLQSTPGGGSESNAVFVNLNNTATMTAYFKRSDAVRRGRGAQRLETSRASCVAAERTGPSDCSRRADR